MLRAQRRASTSASASGGPRYMRLAASPGAALALLRMNFEIDVRRRPAGDPGADADPAPHRRSDESPSGARRYLAEQIPGAKLVELAGDDHIPWVGDRRRHRRRDRGVPDRHAPRRRARPGAGDRPVHRHRRLHRARARRSATGAGATLLDEHHAVVRRELGRFRGREVNTAGDGFLATFDGPARAVRCARRSARRCGRSAWRCAPASTPARSSSWATTSAASPSTSGRGSRPLAGPGEVLVSSTVKDLVAGSGLDVRGARRRTCCGASQTSGGCSRWSAPEPERRRRAVVPGGPIGVPYPAYSPTELSRRVLGDDR